MEFNKKNKKKFLLLDVFYIAFLITLIYLYSQVIEDIKPKKFKEIYINEMKQFASIETLKKYDGKEKEIIFFNNNNNKIQTKISGNLEIQKETLNTIQRETLNTILRETYIQTSEKTYNFIIIKKKNKTYKIQEKKQLSFVIKE